jgi:hypothetical protein
LNINPEHEDYPALLAESLDVLDHHAYDAKGAADWLGCSATQLVNLLREEPRALAVLNARRGAQGLRPYR